MQQAAPKQPLLEMLSLQPVLQLADCRSDLLFFVRLAGAYLQAIYADVFSGQTKNAIARRQRLREMIDGCKELSSADLKEKLKTTALEASAPVDFLSKGVVNFYKTFPAANPTHLTVTDVFVRHLHENHMIYGGFKDYVENIHLPLIELRHLLEHWQERQKKMSAPDIARIVQRGVATLGMLLLPQIAHMLCGRLTYWQHELRNRGDAYKVMHSVEQLRAYFTACHSYRREKNKHHFGLVRTRANMDKARRKSAVSTSLAWAKAHTLWCYAHKDDYKLHEFKWRYYVMGKHNLQRIKSQLKHQGADQQPSFRRDIEPFYLLSCRVNLLLHQATSRLPRNSADKIMLSDKALETTIRHIRNEIAHNGMFWMVYDERGACILSVQQVFATVFEALQRNDLRHEALALVSKLRTVLRKEDYALLDERAKTDQQPHKVRRWTAQKRAHAKQPTMECDKRPAIRREVGKWMRALAKAAVQSGLEHAKKAA